MPQVYVTFEPILVEVPDNVIAALSNSRDTEIAQQVAVNIAHSKLTGGIHNTNVDLKYVASVVKA